MKSTTLSVTIAPETLDVPVHRRADGLKERSFSRWSAVEELAEEEGVAVGLRCATSASGLDRAPLGASTSASSSVTSRRSSGLEP